MDSTRIIKEITAPVMGCTEPAAIALASSLATDAARNRLPNWIEGQEKPREPRRSKDIPVIEALDIRTVRSLYKNALSVGIPGASEGGIHLAASLGPFLDSCAGLNLLKACDESVLKEARDLLAHQGEAISLEVREDDRDVLFVEARVIAVIDGERHVGEAVLRGKHDGVDLIRRDGRTLFRKKGGILNEDAFGDEFYQLSQLNISELISIAESMDKEGQDYVKMGIEINQHASEVGVKNSLGLGIGAALSRLVKQGLLKDDIIIKAKGLAAGAADARMSGADVEVMSSSGSGNQGIMAILPIVAVAEYLKIKEEKLIRAVTLSHLLTASTTVHTGLLSALCGCVVKAGLGATAGVAYIFDAPIDAAITNMAGNITGEICDGAKVGCAVKICTAAGAAVESALMAKEGIRIPSNNGILADSPRHIIENIGEIARSMQNVDRTIVHIMERKEIARISVADI